MFDYEYDLDFDALTEIANEIYADEADSYLGEYDGELNFDY